MDSNKYSAAFKPDGALRDVVVRGTSVEDWGRFRWFLVGGDYTLTFYRDDDEEDLPEEFSALVEEPDVGLLLQIDLGQVVLFCHFFGADEIELDLQPEDVNSEEALESVLCFMMDLGNALDRSVTLTPANRHERPLLSFTPGASSIAETTEEDP